MGVPGEESETLMNGPVEKFRLTVAMVVTSGLLYAPLAQAFSITNAGDRDLNGWANLVGDGAETIAPQSGVYDWDNIDGGGTDASDHLYLGTNRLFTSDGTNITLRLTTIGGPGDIIGESGVTAFDTQYDVVNVGNAGDVTLTNVRDVLIGKIDTRRSGNGVNVSLEEMNSGGDVTIGGPLAGQRARNVRVDDIDTRGVDWERLGGDVTIHASGWVKIQNVSSTVTGSIQTSMRSAYGSSPVPYKQTGSITVIHNGVFLADSIDASAAGLNRGHSGDVKLVGDLDDEVLPAGTLEVRGVYTHHNNAGSFTGDSGDIVIAGYTSVTVSNLWAHNQGTDRSGGHVTITRIAGDIDISGTVDLDGTVNGGSDGNLVLQTEPGSGGIIHVASLDLDLIGYASFDAGARRSFINGPLANFTGANDPSLRVPAGQTLYYDRDSSPALGGAGYPLRDENGTANAGGRLRPWPSFGTVVTIK